MISTLVLFARANLPSILKGMIVGALLVVLISLGMGYVAMKHRLEKADATIVSLTANLAVSEGNVEVLRAGISMQNTAMDDLKVKQENAARDSVVLLAEVKKLRAAASISYSSLIHKDRGEGCPALESLLLDYREARAQE